MDEIVWEEPPIRTSGRGSTLWIDRLSPFVERPGEWGRLAKVQPNNLHSFVANVRRDLQRIPAGTTIGDWEFRTANGASYARYIGKPLRSVEAG